jgi:anti-sigma regulatory factor (Ser/Thr protein kinase)
MRMQSRAEITLVRAPESARQARRFVDGVCADWRITALIMDAETVASELVENTLQHTKSMPRLELELHDDELTVSVSDDNPARAYVREGGGRGGFGMLMVQQTAREWGCTPSGTGGKTVWARLVTEGFRLSPVEGD